jgi:hypothetical protein
MGVSSRLFLVTHDRGDFGHLDFNRYGQVLGRCLLWIGEIGSPAQLVSTLVQRILCQSASRRRASAAPMLQDDTLMSGNSATSA